MSLLKSSRRVLVIVAHPDDETLGAGALISLIAQKTYVLHVTDGAPLNPRWWGDPTLSSRAEYAALRRQEVAVAMSIAGVPRNRLLCLDVPDQRTPQELPAITVTLERAIAGIAPDIVLTQAYEGGHPDHDSVAFAVWAACALVQSNAQVGPRRVEMAGYHRGADGACECGVFLPGGEHAVVLQPTETERGRKAHMCSAFKSQQATIALLGGGSERFRNAPTYDFRAPPHDGPLYYEQFDWGCTGAEWRARAGEAVRGFGLLVDGAT